MAAFVGYCVQANGIHFPWGITGQPRCRPLLPFHRRCVFVYSTAGQISFGEISAAGGPPDQWDALPTAAKLQIIGFIAFLELVGENTYILELSGEKHYMRGGKPGFFPSFKPWMPHPVPFDLVDPFGLQKNMSPEKKAASLIAEINNGRLAMLGIMAFVSEAKVPGSVPALSGLIKPYAGEVMAPFSQADAANLPFVTEMLQYKLF